MKHKLITTKQGKIVVDETAEINVNDFITDSYKIWRWLDNSSLLGRNKVLYTINFSINKDIPMVIIEDEVEKLVKELYKMEDGNFTMNMVNTENRRAFIAGCKMMKEKGIYSEEVLRNAFQCGQQWVKDMTDDKEPENLNQFIQSLNQEYIELEIEQYTQNLHKDIWYERVKTDRVDGQLMAYVKQ